MEVTVETHRHTDNRILGLGRVGGYRWDVFIWELVGGVRYEQTGFTNSTIAHDNTLGEERLRIITMTNMKMEILMSYTPLFFLSPSY